MYRLSSVALADPLHLSRIMALRPERSFARARPSCAQRVDALHGDGAIPDDTLRARLFELAAHFGLDVTQLRRVAHLLRQRRIPYRTGSTARP
ncbi:hypothetical protein SFUMM280S_11287 [Streptomyces fumanus]